MSIEVGWGAALPWHRTSLNSCCLILCWNIHSPMSWTLVPDLGRVSALITTLTLVTV
jgi:hypothetical protein